MWRTGILERCFLICAAMVVLMAGLSGPAVAGPEEDFLEGMKWVGRLDYVTAIPHLKKAADAGHPAAASALASILGDSGYDEEALKYYRQAAKAGNLPGMYGLASWLSTIGDGGKKELAEAKQLFETSAELGYAPSVYAMAQAYILGELGIPEDQRKGAEALKWISRAADGGYMRALEVLEQAYRTGDYGLAVDPVKAEEIKKKIASLKPQVQKKRRRGEAK
jgi:TPR repeat protein